MPNLPLHGYNKQDDEVQEKDWPEYWNVKYLEESHSRGSQDSSAARVPKLEFRESTCERSGGNK